MKLSFTPLLTVIICALTSCIHQQAAEDPAVKAAFERCRVISDEISSIRELDFTSRVAIKVQSKDAFIKYIEKEIDEQYGSKEDVQNYVDALVLLGALKERVEFADTLKEMMVSQAAAHYDPRNKIYYLLMSDVDPFFLDVISSHELCHALQDQNFNLTALIMGDPEAMQDNGDAAMAKQCLAEGDATLVMMWWALTQQMPNTTRAQLSASLSLAVGVQAAMDFDTILDLAKSGLADSAMNIGSIAGSIDDLDSFPRFFMESLYMAYIQGAVAVDHVRTRGGWKAVDELFRNPPSSSEQILHPEKLLGKRDEPVDVRLKKLVDSPPEGWKLAEEDVLGELGIRILLSTWSDKSSKNAVSPILAASGWGGDRYYYLKNKSGDELLVWKTVWDSEKDAEEFAAAIEACMGSRYTICEPLTQAGPLKTWETESGRCISLSVEEKDVLIINATSSKTLIPSLKTLCSDE